MKNLFQLTFCFLFVLLTMITITSCGGDDEDVAPTVDTATDEQKALIIGDWRVAGVTLRKHGRGQWDNSYRDNGISFKKWIQGDKGSGSMTYALSFSPDMPAISPNQPNNLNNFTITLNAGYWTLKDTKTDPSNGWLMGKIEIESAMFPGHKEDIKLTRADGENLVIEIVDDEHGIVQYNFVRD